MDTIDKHSLDTSAMMQADRVSLAALAMKPLMATIAPSNERRRQALQLIAQLYSALTVDLDVSAVFLAPTAQQLAAVLRDKHGFDDADLDEESIEDLERQFG